MVRIKWQHPLGSFGRQRDGCNLGHLEAAISETGDVLIIRVNRGRALDSGNRNDLFVEFGLCTCWRRSTPAAANSFSLSGCELNRGSLVKSDNAEVLRGPQKLEKPGSFFDGSDQHLGKGWRRDDDLCVLLLEGFEKVHYPPVTTVHRLAAYGINRWISLIVDDID